MRMSLSKKVILYTLLTISALFVFLPVIFAFLMSFMNSQDAMMGKIIPSVWTLENYAKAFERLPLLQFLLNSFIISLLIMIGQLVFSSLAAYAFVFLEFKGRDFLFYLFIGTWKKGYEMYESYENIWSPWKHGDNARKHIIKFSSCTGIWCRWY